MKNEDNISLIKNTLFVTFGVVIGILLAFLLLKYTKLSEFLSLNKTITKNGTTVIEKTSISNSVEKSKDAVVMIRSYKSNIETSTGTGFIYKTDDKYGYIMTNEHVVSGVDNVKLVLSDDTEVDGVILGGDEYLDLAVIRIDKKYVLSVAIISDSSKSNVGDTVFTIGSPMGYTYRGTVTSGILSGKDRMIPVSVGNSTTNDYVMKVLQTDAAINPGNSGGPLLNVNGEVIGINSMKLVQQEIEGMGFAIPINDAKVYVQNLEKGKKISRPVLGVSLINVTDRYRLYYYRINVDSSIDSGVVIAAVEKDSAASKAGLEKGDVITKIDDNQITSISNLRYNLYKYKVDDEIQVTYIRNKKENKVKLKLMGN